MSVLAAPTALSSTDQASEAALASDPFSWVADGLIVVLCVLGATGSAGATTLAIADSGVQTGGWSTDQESLSAPGNLTNVAIFTAKSNGTTGTVTVTPSRTGASGASMTLDVYGFTGQAGIGAVGSSVSSLSVSLSSAPAASSLVIGLMGQIDGSDPSQAIPAGFTSLFTDRHTAPVTYGSGCYQDGSAPTTLTFTGTSANNAAVAVEILAADAPDAPILSSVTPSSTQNVVEWATPSDGGSPLEGYTLERSTVSGAETVLISLGVVTTYTDPGLTNGETYFYKVLATNTVGDSPLSNEMSGEPTGPADAAFCITTQRLYETLGPVAAPDEDNGDVLLLLVDSMGSQLDPITQVISDSDDGPGWSSVLDLDRCPSWALRWLGQFGGVTVPATVDDDTARSLIVGEAGFGRGKLAAMQAAAAAYLQPGHSVVFTERTTDAYHLTATIDESWIVGATYAELSLLYPTYPDLEAAFATYDLYATASAQLAAALQAAKPVGLILTVSIT